MRFLIILPIVFVNLVWGSCTCIECGANLPVSESILRGHFKNKIGCNGNGIMHKIQTEIGFPNGEEDDFGADSAMGNLKKLHEITKEKLKSYSALRDLKQEELNELNKINSLLEKLIEQENTRIKILKIKAKDEVNSYE